MQVMLAEKAKELLQNGTVNRVLGWKKGEFAYDITPAMFTTAEQIDAEFVYDDFCANNLSKYLIQESRKEGKVLVFLKPCDTYSFNQLLKEHRIWRDQCLCRGYSLRREGRCRPLKGSGNQGHPRHRDGCGRLCGAHAVWRQEGRKGRCARGTLSQL